MGKVEREDLELESTPMAETLKEVKATLREHFDIRERQGADFAPESDYPAGIN